MKTIALVLRDLAYLFIGVCFGEPMAGKVPPGLFFFLACLLLTVYAFLTIETDDQS